jgi:hypothetical protein
MVKNQMILEIATKKTTANPNTFRNMLKENEVAVKSPRFHLGAY